MYVSAYPTGMTTVLKPVICIRDLSDNSLSVSSGGTAYTVAKTGCYGRN